MFFREDIQQFLFFDNGLLCSAQEVRDIIWGEEEGFELFYEDPIQVIYRNLIPT